MKMTPISYLFKIVLKASIICALLSTAKAKSCPGEGWSFIREKCYKMVETLHTFEDAVKFCNLQYVPGQDIALPRLARIYEEEEQEIVKGLAFNNTYCPGVWLGLTRSSEWIDEFEWDADGLAPQYFNWAPGNPSNSSVRVCVEMMSEDTRAADVQNSGATGDWRDVTCIKGNWVLCEKIPAWSNFDMINAIIEGQYEQRRITRRLEEL